MVEPSNRLSAEEGAELLAALHDCAVLGGPPRRSNGWVWADRDFWLTAEAEIRSAASDVEELREALRALVDAFTLSGDESYILITPDPASLRALLISARAVLRENREPR